MLFNWKIKKQNAVKSVSVYISSVHEQIIIAPYYKNKAGIYFEQEVCSVLSYPVDYSLLGEEVIRNFHLFKIKDENLRERKQKDWAALRYSKLKTLKAFEAAYVKIGISGVNESNIILVIEGVFSYDKELNITASISPFSHKEAIGKLIIKVYKTCLFNNLE